MFKRKVIEAAGVDWDEANEFNECLSFIKGGRVKKLKVEGSLLQSKVAYKVAIYSQSIRYRIIELSELIIELWNEEKFVSCFIMVRSLSETICVLCELEERLKVQIESADISTINDTIENRLFSNRLDGFMDDRAEFKAVNILNTIDKMDKKVSGVRASYNRLSEFLHTNYFGTKASYALIDYNTGTVSFKSTQHTKKNVFGRIGGELFLLNLAISSFKNLDDIIEKIAKIQTQKDLKKNKI